jgi:hypothetical protein
VLVEHLDEGFEGGVENAVHATAAARTGWRAFLDFHMRDFGRAHHVADADRLWRTREFHPAVAATHRFDQFRLGQQVDDLEDVLWRNLEPCGERGNLDEPIVCARAVDQNADGMARRLGQAHRTICSLGAR